MGKLQSCTWVIATQRGFILSLPVVLLAAFSVALGNIPLHYFLDLPVLEPIQAFFSRMGTTAFGIVSLCLSLTISYSLSLLKRPPKDCEEVNPNVVAIISMLCFVAVVLPGEGVIEAAHFGMISVLPAVLSALIATELFYGLLRFPKLAIYRYLNDADPVLPSLLQIILPATLTISVFFLFHGLLSLGQAPASSILADGLEQLFAMIDSPMIRLLLYAFLGQVFWFFGIHGNAMLASIEDQYLDTATAINVSLSAQGEAPTELVTKQLLDVFVYIGGSGTTLALVIAILLSWPNSNQHKLAKISLIPGLFNISEIIVFALPVVLNPIFLIPFVITPVILVLTSYFATVSGFIPPIATDVHWTTPPLIGGYLASGSWHGIFLELVNLLIAIMIYLPFVKVAQRTFYQSQQQNFAEIITEIDEMAAAKAPHLLTRHDRVGGLVRQLHKDLEADIGTERIYLVFQPQLNPGGKAVGVEALCRWNHRIFGPVPPNIFIAIAEETDLIHKVGHWVFNQSCQQLGQWQKAGLHDIKMSINLSPRQLFDPAFFTRVSTTLGETQVRPEHIELEITENLEAGHNEVSILALEQLAQMNFRIAMDDFGMGYSSMLYLKRFQLNTVKLDGALTREVADNQTCREIISAIASLCKAKNIGLVAEYVETPEQRDLLFSLGCEVFQGYFYSPPLTQQNCFNYLHSLNAEINEYQARLIPVGEDHYSYVDERIY